MSGKPLTEKFNRPMKYTDKVFLAEAEKRTRGFYDELFREAIHDAEKAATAACLEPLKELLTKFMHGHDESASNASGDWMGMTICQCGLCRTGRELRGW